MRVFHISGDQFTELQGLPDALPQGGYIWLASARREFEVGVAEVQAALLRWAGGLLYDLHVSDLLNDQLPSHFDYTSVYDLLVFRRLAAGAGSERLFADDEKGTPATARAALEAIDTSPVGFAIFDRVLLTVHPADCLVRDYVAERLKNQAAGGDGRAASRMPTGPADLMLRMVNYMVDSYLELRRLLSKQIDYLQKQLVTPRGSSANLRTLFDSRNSLRLLEDTCEDQRAAIVEWIDALEEWPPRDRAEAAARARAAAPALARRARAHRARADARAPARVVGRDRGADALLGAEQPHQRHHAGAHGADRDLPAAQLRDRLFRHELRRPAADPQPDRLLDRVRGHAVPRRRHERVLLAQALPGANLNQAFRFNARDLALLTVLTIVWGLNWPVMKLGVTGYPPLAFRTLSMWLGLPVLWALLRVQRVPFTIRREDWPELGKLSFTNMIVWHVVAILALQALSSGRAAILGYTMPIFSALWGVAVFGERLKPRHVAGVVAAAIGVALLLWHELGTLAGRPLAALGMLGAAAVWAGVIQSLSYDPTSPGQQARAVAGFRLL